MIIEKNMDIKETTEKTLENVSKYQRKTKKCPHCNKSVKAGYLKLHISAVHEKMKKFNCNQCGKHFAKRFKHFIWTQIF